MSIFKGQGKSGVTAPTTLKTINVNSNRGKAVINESLRKYAGAPHPSGSSPKMSSGSKSY